MMRELTEKDFARAVLNPYYDKLMTTVEVEVAREDLAAFQKLSKINGFPLELILRNCLADFADEIREDD